MAKKTKKTLNLTMQNYLNELTSQENVSFIMALSYIKKFDSVHVLKEPEVSVTDMLNNNIGFKKLFASMLLECRPESFSAKDAEVYSGINGRECQI